jgi:ABC-2 type transport system permease protein/sodium transport system permease protein
LFAKYVSVLTVAMLTALINLVMMTLTIWLSGLGEKLFGPNLFSPLLVVEIFALLLLFASFFSALLLTITSFARSFKEAQAYLIPLMLVSLAPGLAGMIPGIQLTPALAMVPLLNIVLLGRDLFEGSAGLLNAALVVGSTLIYAAGALSVAARVFGAEDVLYNEQTSWTELVRRPVRVRPAPSLSTALGCLCLIFFLTFLVGGLLREASRPAGANPETVVVIDPDVLIAQVMIQMVLATVLFAGLPLVLARWRRVDLRSGFLFHPARLLALLGALLLGAALWPLILELQIGLRLLGWTTLSAAQMEALRRQLEQQHASVPAALQIAFAAVSAVVEEVFFRGFLFTALLRLVKPWPAIVLAAFFFAAFHVAATPAFGLERFLPSFLLGLLLGWVCWRSQSLVPPILFHFCHDVTLASIGPVLASHQSSTAGTALQSLPVPWLVLAGLGTAAGVACLLFSRRPPQRT